MISDTSTWYTISAYWIYTWFWVMETCTFSCPLFHIYCSAPLIFFSYFYESWLRRLCHAKILINVSILVAIPTSYGIPAIQIFMTISITRGEITIERCFIPGYIVPPWRCIIYKFILNSNICPSSMCGFIVFPCFLLFVWIICTCFITVARISFNFGLSGFSDLVHIKSNTWFVKNDLHLLRISCNAFVHLLYFSFSSWSLIVLSTYFLS